MFNFVVRALSRGGRSRSRNRIPHARLWLETLEDRWVPAEGFMVKSDVDLGDPKKEFTLTWAITQANKKDDRDIIRFDIANGATTVKLKEGLPAITNPVIIDAATRPENKPDQVITLTPDENSKEKF